MSSQIEVQPLPHKTRKRTFLFFVFIFLASLPFLYLYAVGYRFDLAKPTTLVSTGGMYVAVERVGAEIYIDGELVRETRTFKKAFYAQSLDVGTHRVHVQKEGYHTWVKELPVSKKLVTEAEAFNLPLVPQVRVISPWLTATGTAVVSTPLLSASTTNSFIATSTTKTKSFVSNSEYEILHAYFVEATTTIKDTDVKDSRIKNVYTNINGTSTEVIDVEDATSTIVSGGASLARAGEDVFATWVGSFEQMPYYYCAPDFPRYGSSTMKTAELVEIPLTPEEKAHLLEEAGVMHPVQTIPKDTDCDPRIKIDRKWQEVNDFDFFPGSTDFVILALNDGIYEVEVDDRSWQNVQPLIMGENLSFHVENGTIYVYDGTLIYQIVLQTE